MRFTEYQELLPLEIPETVQSIHVSLPERCIVYAEGGSKLWHVGRYYGSEAAEQFPIVSCPEIAAQL